MNICYECRIKLNHKPKDEGCHTARRCECEVCGKVEGVLPSKHWIVTDDKNKEGEL